MPMINCCRVSKKGQLTVQFLILVGVMFIVFIVFIAGLGSKYKEIEDSEESVIVKDIGLKIKKEIDLVPSLSDGYERNFEVPLYIKGKNYSIFTGSGYLSVYTADHEFTARIPNIVGSVSKGENVIRKIDGVIYVNTT